MDLPRLGVRLVAVGLLLAATACTRAPPAPQAKPQPNPMVEAPRVEASVGAIYALSQASGMVIAVVHGDQAKALAYGTIDPKSGRPADAKTLVRLQSVSKLFAADLLASLAGEGRVK